MKNHLVIAFVLAILAGCGNKDEAKTVAPTTLAAPGDSKPTVVPAPPPPPNAVNDGVQRPAPGQAGDTSNPAFKDGGKPDPKK